MDDKASSPDVRAEHPTPGALENESDLLLGRLRAIVLEPYQARLDDMERQIEALHGEVAGLRKGELEPEEVGDVLAAAIRGRGENDQKLARAMSPLVELGLQTSVKKNPQPLVDVIFPVIGPAIRKSIASAMRALVASVNRTVESTFTPRGIKWRLEAWRSGKPYAEVVLKHTLLYRVEGAYLIHRGSGLLLQHAVAPEVEMQSPVLVTSMLTAIEDFARDSFSTNRDEGLEQFRVGDLTVLVESGPHAALALAVRGVAVPELRIQAQEALESVHRDFRGELQDFDGQSAPFEASQPALEVCLRDEMREDAKKGFPVAALAVGLLLVTLAALYAITWVSGRVERKHWHAYIDRLRAQPGLMVVHTAERDGKYRLLGMRDPLAPDPLAMLDDHPVPRGRVEARWEYFRSQHPDYVMLRARQVLRPPAKIRLELDDRTLSAHGYATLAWSGQAERLAPLVPGVAQFDGRGLRDARLAGFQAAVASVEGVRLDVAAREPNREPALREGARALTLRLRALDAQAARAGARVLVRLVVPDESNQDAAWQRAVGVRDALMEEQWKATLIEVVVEEAPDALDRMLRVQAQVRFASSMPPTDG